MPFTDGNRSYVWLAAFGETETESLMQQSDAASQAPESATNDSQAFGFSVRMLHTTYYVKLHALCA